MPRKYAEVQSSSEVEDLDELSDVQELEIDDSKLRRKFNKKYRYRYYCKWGLGIALLLAVTILSIIILSLKGYVMLPNPNNNTTTTNSISFATSATFVLQAMDPSVEPCTDFYRYACGGWINSYQLSDDEASHTRSFSGIHDQNTALLNQLMQADDLEYVSPAYRLCMNVTRLDTRGLDPIQSYYQRIEATTNLTGLMTLLGQLSTEGVSLGAFFSLGVSVDDMDPNRFLLVLWQSGLTLPDPSYYQRDTGNLSSWIGTVFAASPDGAINATAIAGIITLETQLSIVSYSATQNRDIDQIYNNVTVATARTTLGQLAGYLDAFSLSPTESINLAQLNYFRALGTVVSRRSFTTLKLYVKLKLYESTFHLLGQQQRNVSHSYREMIYGTSSTKPRTEYCVSAINSAMPMLVGYYYVQQNNVDITEATEILEAVEQSYSSAFGQLSWMDAETAAAAEQKLEAITNKVGWPTTWPNFTEYYDTVPFTEYFELQLALARKAVSKEFLQRNETVDRRVWGMSPSEFPFYMPGNAKAMNYGGLGVVQGHELGHAFDDGGSRYDAQGYLRDWWTPASRSLFETEVRCVEQQFSDYQVAPGVNVHGSLVVGEAMGDIGGVANAFSAYQRWRLTSDAAGTEEVLVMEYFNMSSTELFFVSFAQAWCSVASSDYLVMLTSTNPHPPGQFRVLGTLTDTPQFSEVFGCAIGTTYNPESTCDLW